ncbi:hypothetical protein [Flavobacterium sp.]|uniref:hypothetical protein n=1 Tax=Flavobacterium sp. TaxID=239 RepID=UPI003919577F
MIAIDKLSATFKLERIIYTILTTITALSIISIGLYLTLTQTEGYKSFYSLCVPTGALTLCINRIFKIWNDIYKLLNS